MDVNEVADAIRSLINSSPRSPTKDQLVGLLNARVFMKMSKVSEMHILHDCDKRKSISGTPSFIGHGNADLSLPQEIIIGKWCYPDYRCGHCNNVIPRAVAMGTYIDWIKEQYGLRSQNKWGKP